jgi:membrane-associated phospholipid phosphatase
VSGMRIAASRAWLVAAGVCVLCFVLLAVGVTRSVTLDGVDPALRHAVLDLRTPGLTVVMRIFTLLGTLPVVVGTTLTGALVLGRRTRSWVPPLVLASGVALSALVTALVKVGVGRARPSAEDRLGPAALDFAFPSGHTGDGSTALLAVTVLICLTLPRGTARRLALAGAVLLATGIGSSRVYLGYHWPSDVVGGWLLATSFTCLVAYASLFLRAHGTRTWSDVGGTIVLVDRAC